MAKTLEKRAWDASHGVLEPSARRTVPRGIYDELRMSANTGGVVFDHVVILAGVIIRNSTATGTIILPKGTTTVDLGGSQVNIQYWSWQKICEKFGA